jgi:hypothetical protein
MLSNNNGFFKYNSKTNIDLTRCGIWSETVVSNYDDTCLVLALRNGGLSLKKQEIIKRMIKNRCVSFSDIQKICDASQIQIILKTEDKTNQNRRIYGKEYDEVYHIGCLIDHYFIIEPIEYTSYSIKNYNEVKDLPNFNQIYGLNNTTYKRNDKHYIDTFKLIKLMLLDKDTFFTDIRHEDINIITNTIQNSIDAIHNNLINESKISNTTNVTKISECADINNVNDSTVLVGKTFNTIGDLKMCTDVKKVILFITHIKDVSIKNYLDKWIYESYYLKKPMRGNLTDRIKNIGNGICYKQIMQSAFHSYDIKNNVTTSLILETSAINIIKDLHNICPSTCGSFIDYLIRRIICELIKKPFDDSRANKMLRSDNLITYHSGNDNIWEYIKNDDWGRWQIKKEPNLSSDTVGEINERDTFTGYEKKDEWLKIRYKTVEGWVRWKLPKTPDGETIDLECYNDQSMNIENKYIQQKKGDNIHICSTGCKYDIYQTKYFAPVEYSNSCSLESCQYISYEKVKNTHIYKTKDILYDIFLISLCHTEAFGFCPKQDTFNAFQNKVCSLNVESLVVPLTEMCRKLIDNKINILLNPALGGRLSELENTSIPSDADLVLDHVLIDIKCTETNNASAYYEIFQLLGYAGLLLLHDKYKQKINSIVVLNLLEGTCKNHDISYLEKDCFIKYIKLLDKARL